MKTNSIASKFAALALCGAMMTTMMPAAALADEAGGIADEEAAAQVVASAQAAAETTQAAEATAMADEVVEAELDACDQADVAAEAADEGAVSEAEGMDALSTGEMSTMSTVSITLNGVTYSLNTSSCVATVKSYSGTSKVVSIPSTVSYSGNTYMVREIGSSAFEGKSITSVTLPSSLTKIGYRAFYGCSSLTSITLPENLTDMGTYAFANCYSVTQLNIKSKNFDGYTVGVHYFDNLGANTSGVKVVFESGVTVIRGCILSPTSGTSSNEEKAANVTSIVIGKDVQSIGNSAFESLTNLKSVQFEGNLCTEIGNYAFENCTSLTTIELPSSLKKIGVYAFWGCSSMKSMIIPSGVTASNIGARSFVGWAQGSTLTVTTQEQYNKLKNQSTSSPYYTAERTTLKYKRAFPDVSDTSAWYYAPITRAVDAGYVSGYDSGYFGPADCLTRAQAAVILWRYYNPTAVANYNAGTTANSTGMSDVASYSWYTGAANWAVSVGIINGYEDGTFHPDDTITREQLCAIVSNASKRYKGSQVTGASRTKLNSMPDAGSVDGWATDAVAWGLNKGVISGKEVGSSRVLDPLGSVTRAEMAAILMNSIDNSLLK